MDSEQILNASNLLGETKTFVSTLVENSTFDLGNLLIIGSEIMENETFQQTAHRLSNELMKKLLSLPVEEGINGALIQLPAPTMKIPRQKHAPQEKVETKWEAFARRKGIKSKKASKKWDPISQSWKPLYGKNSLKNTSEDWMLEHKPEELGDYEDPFIKKQKERKAAIAKQQKRQLANSRRAVISASKELIGNNSSALTIGTSSETARPISKTRLERAIQRIQDSTRSMGVFDEKVKGDSVSNKKSLKKITSLDAEAREKSTQKTLRRVTREYEEKRGSVSFDKMANQAIKKKNAAKTKIKQSDKAKGKKVYKSKNKRSSKFSTHRKAQKGK